MKDLVGIGERLSPDTVARLERAALKRFETAEILRVQRRHLAALYFYGYSAEICLAAACFRSLGFSANDIIDRDTRRRRMAQAKLLKLMNNDPHPLVGWARFLEWKRLLLGGLTQQDQQRLKEAINKATLIYSFWRPELRYKVIEITDAQLQRVHPAAKWLVDNQMKL